MAKDRVEALVLIGTKARCDPNPERHRDIVGFIESHGVAAAWDTYWAPLFDGEWAQQEAARAIATRQTVQGLVNGVTAFHTRPSREKFIADCDIPVHLVTGDTDVLPGLAYLRTLNATAKNATLHVVKSCGDYVPMAQPDALNGLLVRVLDDANARRDRHIAAGRD